jgi:hypothetical protein
MVTSNTINAFKTSMDKFWQDQEVLHNWMANIAGTVGHNKEQVCK